MDDGRGNWRVVVMMEASKGGLLETIVIGGFETRKMAQQRRLKLPRREGSLTFVRRRLFIRAIAPARPSAV